jgi:pimeloyl-ACP methyl ester carboxylesterase
VLNTLAPTNFNVAGIVDLATKPPILWFRGADDAIVSDTSFFDLNFLGQVGAIPGWPGAEVAPAQPMVSQTRAVLERYAGAGGSYHEIVYEETGHSTPIERTDEFAASLADALPSA